MLDHRIDTFLTLCEMKNYTNAAKKLCMTQPAVTQHIKYLENYYGCSLFRYEGKQLFITTKGEELRKLALAMKSNDQRIYDKMSYRLEGLNHIRLGATKSIADYILPQAITRYMCLDSSRLADLVTDNTVNLLEQLKEGAIVIAVVEGSFNKNEFEYELLREEPFLCVASGKMFDKLPGTIEELFDYRLIIREKGSGTRSILERYLTEHNYDTSCFQVQMEVDNFMSIKAMTAAGLGVTFLYRMVMEEELEKGELIIVPIEGMPIHRPLYFVYSKDSLFKEEYRDFIRAFCHAQEAD